MGVLVYYFYFKGGQGRLTFELKVKGSMLKDARWKKEEHSPEVGAHLVCFGNSKEPNAADRA